MNLVRKLKINKILPCLTTLNLLVLTYIDEELNNLTCYQEKGNGERLFYFKDNKFIFEYYCMKNVVYFSSDISEFLYYNYTMNNRDILEILKYKIEKKFEILSNVEIMRNEYLNYIERTFKEDKDIFVEIKD